MAVKSSQTSGNPEDGLINLFQSITLRDNDKSGNCFNATEISLRSSELVLYNKLLFNSLFWQPSQVATLQFKARTVTDFLWR